MPTAIELARELEQKQGELNAHFEKHKKDGALDMPMEAVLEARRRNDELTELGKKHQAQVEMERMAGEVEASLKGREQKPAVAVPFGGSQAHHLIPEQKSLSGIVLAKGFHRSYKSHPNGLLELPDFDVKTLMSRSAGFDPEVLRSGEVVPYASEAPRVVDVIPKVGTTQVGYRYMEQTTRTNGAVATDEGGAYGEAAFVYTQRTSDVEKIAVYVPVTDEQLEDEPAVQALIESDLRLMLAQKLDEYLVSGSGTAPQLRGLLNVASIQTQAKGSDPVPDAIYKAMTKVRVNGKTQANVVLMHPNDFQDVRLLRTADGIYIWGNPSEVGPERMFGLAVVQSTNVTENTGIVFDSNFSLLAVKNGSAVMAITNSHEDNFINGIKCIRMSFRAAFVNKRPSGICTVTGI